MPFKAVYPYPAGTYPAYFCGLSPHLTTITEGRVVRNHIIRSDPNILLILISACFLFPPFCYLLREGGKKPLCNFLPVYPWAQRCRSHQLSGFWIWDPDPHFGIFYEMVNGSRKKSFFLVARPLRGGGGKVINKYIIKKNFFKAFFYFVPNLKYKIFYFNDFTILLNYVVGWQCRSFLTDLLQSLAKNMAPLVQKCLDETFFVKIRFSDILRLKKKRMKKSSDIH